MPETETIQVLGRGTNVNFSIDDSVPFELAERRLREYLAQCRGLYSKGTVSVNVGRRILAADQMSSIRDILAQETGLTVTSYWCPPEVLSRALAGPESTPAHHEPVEGRAPVEIPESHPDDPIDPADFPGWIVAGPADPAIPCETARPEGQQLSMAFPGLDAEQPIPDGRQRAVGYTLESKESNDEAGPATAETGAGAGPADTAGDEQLLAGGESAEETVAGPVSRSLDEGTEEDGEQAHSLFQSVGARGSQALIIKNTCRSGEVVRYQGDVVVFGDVNPGAEIVAGGDIVVLGALRGMAHAGADGNLKATILALNLESHRLQIGSCVGERPRDAKKGRSNGKAVNPQIAFLRRGSIFVAPFERRCEEYRGGVPYEG